MIKEIVNFMKLLPEDFKTMGSQPKEGLHILMKLNLSNDGVYRMDMENFTYEKYTKKDNEVSPFLEQCKKRHENAWCIDTNKCFDLPTKAIHSCSPFLVAFKKEHIRGGAKYTKNEQENKKQIYERFSDYFFKALELLETDEERLRLEVFQYFFVQDQFSTILDKISEELEVQQSKLEEQIALLKEQEKSVKEKSEKEKIKIRIKELEQNFVKAQPLVDSEYILFYLDEPMDIYQEAHSKYLVARLFNTDKYNVERGNLVYGTSNFLNGYNNNMPFLMHQTASFDITGRVSNVDAKLLYEFTKLLPNKTLPSPLPIFIYEEELEHKMIGLIKENDFKLGYQELIVKLLSEHKKDLGNYYLLFWQNTKDGLAFRDFDFVTKFEYMLAKPLKIENLFELKEKKEFKQYAPITNVFMLEQFVLKPFIHNKYHNLNYFSDLSKDGYEELDGTYQSYAKYRKTVYDYVYKSQMNLINEHIFYEMVFNAIKDDLKRGNADYGIKDKLNIWYSTQHQFNQKNKEYMGDKLKEYQSFVAELVSEEGTSQEANDAYFAFTAGMVINYIISKSKSANTSYQLLEPYLQQSKCTEFKKAIARDFARYKHENFSRRYDRAAAFVLSYETNTNLKDLLPQILSGVFANNQLYSNK